MSQAKWERDEKWWWGWYDNWSIGITWLDSGPLHVRGIFIGPIRVYWEKWTGEE